MTRLPIEGRLYPMRLVDPVRNSSGKRPPRRDPDFTPRAKVEFDPSRTTDPTPSEEDLDAIF